MTTEAAPRAPYTPANPGFGFTDVLGLDAVFLSVLTRPRLLGLATELLGGTFRFHSLKVGCMKAFTCLRQ